MSPKKGGLSESLVINADSDTIMEALLDFESYPDWMSGVDEIEIVERDKKGRGTEVRYVVDAVMIKIRYVLKYSYKENMIEIGYIEGDLEDCTASYEFEPVDDDRTEVTYYFDVSYSLPKAFRGPVVKMLLRQVDKRVMKSALKDVKKRVESG
ncbi:MAG: SRPBCC family protein [Actinobacteria bacterium]|nr:SRPBCC family protein [Actinomycetota bacterium]MCG2818555.1 SRPBCC family protein [Actinomycetes bacterium]MBU4218256.1 SRPBCC family protein [Actinomycetota bacterium]MBU4358681.1 SRPBCC family protein [Actinomycetota bacterium]MBU4392004.1 SRPBCC family protein [Actinomycetota bacterium]